MFFIHWLIKVFQSPSRYPDVPNPILPLEIKLGFERYI
jgi:hypothetical protein